MSAASICRVKKKQKESGGETGEEEWGSEFSVLRKTERVKIWQQLRTIEDEEEEEDEVFYGGGGMQGNMHTKGDGADRAVIVTRAA